MANEHRGELRLVMGERGWPGRRADKTARAEVGCMWQGLGEGVRGAAHYDRRTEVGAAMFHNFKSDRVGESGITDNAC